MKCFRLIHVILAAFAVCALPSCAEREEYGVEGERRDVPVQLAFSLFGDDIATKADAASLTELANQGHFRGMENIRIIPYASTTDIAASTAAISVSRNLPDISGSIDNQAYSGTATYHTGLIKNNHAHLYPDASAALPEGTGAVLIYGKAPLIGAADPISQKHLNGSMTESGWSTDGLIAASDLFFEPEPIYTDNTSTAAAQILTILNYIVKSASYTQAYFYKVGETWHTAFISVTWNEDIADETLRDYFRWITGDSQLMTGAGSNLEYMLTSLYRRLLDFSSLEEDVFKHTTGGVQYSAVLTQGGEDTFTYKYLYEKLRDVIVGRFDDLVNSGDLSIDATDAVSFANGVLKNYPRSLGLPSGSAVLRWKDIEFVQASEGLDGIAPISRFCYMPSLYYFASTTISTSDDRTIYNKYKQDYTTWESILDEYRLGKVVNSSTHSVALDDPLQYSCSMLVATVQATATILGDNDGDNRTYCSAAGTNFPITGILISSQFRQKYNFTPDDSSDEYNLYDRNITGVYLTTSESAQIRTLVFPTPADRDIYFYLELRNDSEESFTGAEGVIVPGQYFYLAGKLEKSTDPNLPQVFMQDHLTTARCRVSSMENAHICVPEMGSPQLQLGVQTAVNWKIGASSYVILD